MAYLPTLALCLFFLLISPSIAKTTSFRPRALVLPVTKDSATGQYITQLRQRTPLVPIKLTVDLGGPSAWVDCEENYISSSYKPVKCRSAVCKLADSRACKYCNASPSPGCHNNSCALFPDNTITFASTASTVGEVAQDVVSLQSTDGSNPGRIVSAPRFAFTCAPSVLLNGLAKGVKGMAGLGRGGIGLPSQLASAFSFPRKFAICLGSKGVIFFGESPYKFLPGKDVSKSLIYTPLFVAATGDYFKGDKSPDYFIGVKSIKIDGKPVPINSTLLKIFDKKLGQGGTKISTVNPYTVMETSIYKAFIRAFSRAFSGVPRVAPVAPFGVCFNSSKLGSTRVGPPVPTIDLVLQNQKVFWRIFGANLMVQVKKDVLCLGFVDGGLNPKTSIVIGTKQIENNLLQFDLARSRLGFSSNLLFQQTTCSNFNFTSTA